MAEQTPSAPARSWKFAGVPSWRDPRWGQVAALSTWCVLGQTSVLHFAITLQEVVLVLCTTIGLDVALTLLRKQLLVVPLSGAITGLGLAMLLRSSYPLVFLFAGLMAIGSKHVITDRGRHRFNPSNFGLIAALAFTQGGISHMTPGQWGHSTLIFFAVCCAGSLVVFRAERLTLVAMFVIAQVGAYALFHGGDPNLNVSLTGAVLAFAFFMITDPKTAPHSRRGQAAYVVAIAGLGQVFNLTGSMAGPFAALFLVCALMPLVERVAASDAVQSRVTALRSSKRSAVTAGA